MCFSDTIWTDKQDIFLPRDMRWQRACILLGTPIGVRHLFAVGSRVEGGKGHRLQCAHLIFPCPQPGVRARQGPPDALATLPLATPHPPKPRLTQRPTR